MFPTARVPPTGPCHKTVATPHGFIAAVLDYDVPSIPEAGPGALLTGGRPPTAPGP
jgi:hypothetical protein